MTWVVRDDLADRALFLTLAPIPGSDRKPEADVLADFVEARPRILGALLDAVAVGLRRLPSVELDHTPAYGRLRAVGGGLRARGIRAGNIYAGVHAQPFRDSLLRH